MVVAAAGCSALLAAAQSLVSVAAAQSSVT